MDAELALEGSADYPIPYWTSRFNAAVELFDLFTNGKQDRLSVREILVWLDSDAWSASNRLLSEELERAARHLGYL